jgi:hypothetical protein
LKKEAIRKVLPMKFDFLCEPVIWKYKYGKMNFVNAFIVGLQSNMTKQNSEYSSHIYVLKNK